MDPPRRVNDRPIVVAVGFHLVQDEVIGDEDEIDDFILALLAQTGQFAQSRVRRVLQAPHCLYARLLFFNKVDLGLLSVAGDDDLAVVHLGKIVSQPCFEGVRRSCNRESFA